MGRQLDDLGVVWFEEPVSSEDLAVLRLVRRSLDCDVTAGEYGARIEDFAALCAVGAVDCLQVDPSRCGGVTEWLRAAAVAAGHGHGRVEPDLTSPGRGPHLREAYLEELRTG